MTYADIIDKSLPIKVQGRISRREMMLYGVEKCVAHEINMYTHDRVDHEYFVGICYTADSDYQKEIRINLSDLELPTETREYNSNKTHNRVRDRAKEYAKYHEKKGHKEAAKKWLKLTEK